MTSTLAQTSSRTTSEERWWHVVFSPRKKLVGFHRPPWGCPNKKRFPSEPLTGNHGVGGRKRTSFWNRFQHGKQRLSTSVNWCQLWCQLQNRNVKRSSRDHGSMVLPVLLTSEVHPGMSGQNRAAGTLEFRDLFCVKSMDFRWIFTEASMIFFWMIRCFYRFSSRCFLFWFHFFWKKPAFHTWGWSSELASWLTPHFWPVRYVSLRHFMSFPSYLRGSFVVASWGVHPSAS